VRRKAHTWRPAQACAPASSGRQRCAATACGVTADASGTAARLRPLAPDSGIYDRAARGRPRSSAGAERGPASAQPARAELASGIPGSQNYLAWRYCLLLFFMGSLTSWSAVNNAAILAEARAPRPHGAAWGRVRLTLIRMGEAKRVHACVNGPARGQQPGSRAGASAGRPPLTAAACARGGRAWFGGRVSQRGTCGQAHTALAAAGARSPWLRREGDERAAATSML